MSAAVAGAALALALLLLLPRQPRVVRGHVRRWRPVLAVLLVAGVLSAPSRGALLLIGAGLVAGVTVLLRRRRRRSRAVEVQQRVREACELVAAELAAGQPPGGVLRRAAEEWPDLRPVADAFELGGDVPAALRDAAAAPGAGDLRLLAAAWAVAHRTGHGLADAVGHCAESLRAAGATRRLVAGELASARATARLVAGLPVLALAMGSGAGGDPVGFLLGHPVGLACLGGGLLAGFVGLWWIEAIADDVEDAT